MSKIFSLFSKKARGQAWSTDLIIAAVIFILVIAVFYTLMTQEEPQGTEGLEIEAKNLAAKLDADQNPTEYSIIYRGTIDEDKLENLYAENYEDLKKEFDLSADFCIFIEDQDGNLIQVTDPVNKVQRVSIGKGDVSIGGVSCGQPFG